MHLGSVGVSRNGGRTAKGWNIAICMLLGLCLMLWITPPVHADDSAGLGITATDDITDTQNLLGSNVSEITDAINQTKKETGVTVRLVYLDSFNAKGKPDKWVSALLESLNPKPNTVMLAVASNDGNLVVAVSSNSEEWLKKKSTVDALSDAAQKPLMESDPDWAKSATDMMNQISVQKKTSTSSRTIWIGVGGFAGALLLLVVILVVFLITFVQRFCLFSVVWFTYRAFGLTGQNPVTVSLLYGMISVAVDMLPLPGGMGISETLFSSIFLPIFGAELVLPGMILCRGISYYTQLLISAIMTVAAHLVFRKKAIK